MIFALAFFVLSTGADLGSTLYVMGHCSSCKELNPIMAPIVNRPRFLIPIVAVSSTGVVLGTVELKRQQRKFWWAMPVALGVAHLVVARHNMGLVK